MIKSFAVLVLFLIVSCAGVQQPPRQEDKADKILQETFAASERQRNILSEFREPQVPEFVPVKEGSSPLKTKKISIAARNTPLRDVLYTIAETASLNVVMERGVDPDLPITMTFEDITVEDALNILSDAVNYYYSVETNILIVKAMGTEIFELGRPNVVQDYSIDVGGNILSGTSTASGGENVITGDVTVKAASDKASYQFWEGLEKSIEVILHTEEGAVGGAQQASFVVNRMAGAIMVTATKSDLERVRNYIARLKTVLNRQVLVEARVVEVQLSDDLKYGIDWNAVIKGIGVDRLELGTRLFSDFLDFGPRFQMTINDDDFLMLMTALQEQGDVKTLSNPRVSIMNGQTSLLSVGTNVTFISRVETTTTVSEGSAPIINFTVDTNSVLSGIMFGIVPFIDSEHEITMTITPIITDLVELKSETIGSEDNSIEIQLPTVDLREMTTTVKVLDGNMIIIGGLIDKKERLKEDKIPILGDLPFIGGAFKSVDNSYKNKELVIMLVPKIVNF